MESAEKTNGTPQQGLWDYKKCASAALEITEGCQKVKVPQGGLGPLQETGPSSCWYQAGVTSPGAGGW